MLQLGTLSAVPESMCSMAWMKYSPTMKEKIKDMLTIASKYDAGPIKLYRENGDFLLVPRELCTAPPKVDNRSYGSAINCNMKFAPRNEEQARLIQESVGLLKSGKNHVIRATTGFGKSFCGIAIAAALNTTTLIVVTKSDLMGEKQWRGAIKKFTDCTDADIGIIQQDVCDYKGKKFVLAMVQSLVKDKYPAAMKQWAGLVIFDEVHRMGADTFSEATMMFPAALRLGLSATPKRIDDKDFVFRAHIGPIMVSSTLVSMPPKVIFQKTRFTMPLVVRKTQSGGYHKIPLPHSAGKMMAVYKAMAGDKARNTMLIDFLVSAYKKGRTIIVFSDLKEAHLEPLYWMAKARGIPALDMAYYVGGLKESTLDIARTKRVLFATYAMCSEATDIPNLDTAILATPRANVEQVVGRILREVEGKKQPVVFDPIDECSAVLTGYASKRRVIYLKLGGNILYV